MQCKQCGAMVQEKPGGHRAREFCSGRCKTAYWRVQHGMVPAVKVEASRLADLERDLHEARARIKELEQERDQQPAGISPEHKMLILDVERLFAYDTTAHAQQFKVWLKKHSVGLPDVGKKMLADKDLPTQRSRSLYEAHLRLAGYSKEEIREFQDVWRYMLVTAIVTTL